MAAINRDQFDVRFLSCNKWLRCASCESAEHQLVRGRLISQSGRLRNQIFGSLLGSLLGSLSGHFLPHSFPCLPQQAPPITSKMAPMVIALFYLAAQIPSGLLCASPEPDLDSTFSPKDDQNPRCPHFSWLHQVSIRSSTNLDASRARRAGLGTRALWLR